MDERTRRTIQQAPPDPRTVPAPIITKPRGGRTRIVLGLVVVIGLLVVGYLIFHLAFPAVSPPSAGRFQQAGGTQSVGVATVGRGDIRVVLNALGTVTPIAALTVVA